MNLRAYITNIYEEMVVDCLRDQNRDDIEIPTDEGWNHHIYATLDRLCISALLDEDELIEYVQERLCQDALDAAEMLIEKDSNTGVDL